MRIEKISDIYESLKKDVRKKRLVVAYANDSHSIEAVYTAVQMGLVEAILVGDQQEITKVCQEQGYDLSCFEIIHEPVDSKGAQKAVEWVREGKADVIMKGLVSTDKYMRAILNKERGLVEPNTILSHVTVMECPGYHKLLVISDVAVIPLPDLNQKIAMIKYVTLTAKSIGGRLSKGCPDCSDRAGVTQDTVDGRCGYFVEDGGTGTDLQFCRCRRSHGFRLGY